uniref:Uncharacterized protein n=1 Tax=viral metagenome TaxID=1070528 RepID=A0A6C0J0K0_9ZZZZ
MSESPRYFQYASTEHEHRYISRYGGYFNDDDDDDTCQMCEKNIPLYNCNKCGECICEDENCCMKFPHHFNTTYFVCMNCVNVISVKLILQIDLGKLELLKEKIRTGSTCNSVCSSRTTSRSSYSDNTNSISSLSEVSTPNSNRERHNSITSSSSGESMIVVKI